MQSENVIEVNNITKKFKIYLDKGTTLKEKILFRNRRKFEERVVLDNISFSIKKGESVGLIGSNGCGKSTTLKLLTKIMYPDVGTIKMEGRVSSLLELGAGFHPDMSGRENIYINASIFGLTRKEIDSRIKKIIEFSELEQFIDNPVRTYSSGMYMRLAFSVAINVDADILLIDEILAVGDANFQAKCFDKLREIKCNGTTIVIVSHALGQIEQFCDRSIWIDSGKIRMDDIPRKVHPKYMNYIMEKTTPLGEKTDEEVKVEEKQTIIETDIDKVIEDDGSKFCSKEKVGNKKVVIVDAYTFDMKTNQSKEYFGIGDNIGLRISYFRNNDEIINTEVGFNIYRNDGVDCFGTNTIRDEMDSIEINKSGDIDIFLYDVMLLEGVYTIDLALHDRYGHTYQHIYSAIQFEIRGSFKEVGVTSIKHKWIF